MTASIIFNEETKSFHLTNKSISYIMQVVRDGYLLHHYYGSALDSLNLKFIYKGYERDGCPVPFEYADERTFSLDYLSQECPTFGTGDYRVPALKLRFKDGSTVVDLRYHSHRIYKGKPSLNQLPQARLNSDEDASTLEITLKDKLYDLYVVLSYTIFSDLDVIIRSVKVDNQTNEAFDIESCQSICLDLHDCDYQKIHLHGTHANERQIERKDLGHHVESVNSARCASSHQHSPFVALVREETTEDYGEVIASSLIWSGNFEATTEVNHFGKTRLIMGINSFDFKYHLEPQEQFYSPEGVLVYSKQGLNYMSQTFHKFINKHIIAKKWQNTLRPVLFNSWEAAYFDFTEDSIVEFAKGAKDVGAELVVLDDGWFGKRNDDRSSLGDWTIVSKNKLPNGIVGLCKRINELGLDFGLWFEPESVSPDSELYRQHPEWAFHIPNRNPCQGRSELVLNFARQEVIDYVFDAMSTILSSCPIRYIKTDMTRSAAELYDANLPAERQGEIAYRYQLGVYQLFDRLNKAFPEVLIEGCAGGGRRFDMGMLCYQPQIWTSDNTDAIARLNIQYGTSLVYPNVTMTSHVSVTPNHQIGRTTPLDTRFICAISGNLGYEMDVNKSSAEEKQAIQEQVSFYKQYRKELQYGKLYRITSPFDKNGNECSWNIISEDQKHVFVMYFKSLTVCNPSLKRVKVKGLDENAKYKVIKQIIPTPIAPTMGFVPDRIVSQENEVFSAQELMNFGLLAERIDRDFCGYLWVLEKQD